MSKEVNKVYRSIESAKKRLIGKAKKEGCLWENFGQNEVENSKLNSDGTIVSAQTTTWRYSPLSMSLVIGAAMSAMQ